MTFFVEAAEPEMSGREAGIGGAIEPADAFFGVLWDAVAFHIADADFVICGWLAFCRRVAEKHGQLVGYGGRGSRGVSDAAALRLPTEPVASTSSGVDEGRVAFGRSGTMTPDEAVLNTSGVFGCRAGGTAKTCGASGSAATALRPRRYRVCLVDLGEYRFVAGVEIIEREPPGANHNAELRWRRRNSERIFWPIDFDASSLVVRC